MKRNFDGFIEELESLVTMLSLSHDVQIFKGKDNNIKTYRIYVNSFTILIRYNKMGFHRATIYFEDYRKGYHMNPLKISIFTHKKFTKEIKKLIKNFI